MASAAFAHVALSVTGTICDGVTFAIPSCVRITVPPMVVRVTMDLNVETSRSLVASLGAHVPVMLRAPLAPIIAVPAITMSTAVPNRRSILFLWNEIGKSRDHSIARVGGEPHLLSSQGHRAP